MSARADVIREHVAGVARSLWSMLGPTSHKMLMAESGAFLAYVECLNKTGSNMTWFEWAHFNRQRLNRANAAQWLHVECGVGTREWLKDARPSRITQVAFAHRIALNSNGGAMPLKIYCEQHGDRVIAAPGSESGPYHHRMRVADAAQWLWMNREPGFEKITSWSSDVITATEKACKTWDAHPQPWDDKKYSLSDLVKAYDMGFAASGEGWNQEIHPNYLDNENYQAERLEALREFSKCQ